MDKWKPGSKRGSKFNGFSDTPSVDIQVYGQGSGSVFLFTPLTDAGREWIAENVSEPIWFGGGIAVEHGYARNLAAGMVEDGLVVR